MEKNKKILTGEKASPYLSALSDFEYIPVAKWQNIKRERHIPDNFLFLAGVAKYPKHCRQAHLRFGKDLVFVQSFLPYSDSGIYKTRGYGNIYCMYEPDVLHEDDIVLEEAAIYQALPGNTIRLVLANGEHRQENLVRKMFVDISAQRGLQDFSYSDDKLGLYEVTFTRKSCGYFLKGRTYQVWATPVGIPDQLSGELVKGWLCCDVNCGVPAIVRADQEMFCKLSSAQGSKIGLFTLENDRLVF